MRIATLAGAIALAVFSMPAAAARGEVCSSKPASTQVLNDELVFECHNAGTMTIPQLYAKGWRVVAVMPTMAPALHAGKMTWTIVIEEI